MNSKIKYLIFASCCVVALMALASFASIRKKEKICKKVDIKIANEYNNYFISDEDVEALLMHEGMQILEGRNAKNINLKELETRLKKHPFVKDAQVSRNLEGSIKVYVKQKRPIARLLHANHDVYIDEEGSILPLSERYTARVIPITKSAGFPVFTTEFLQGPEGQPYMALLNYIEQNDFWKSQIAQLHISNRGKVTLLPQVGDQVIEFGRPDNIENKFAKLMVFYNRVLPKVGWDRYSRINIEYQEQIICE